MLIEKQWFNSNMLLPPIIGEIQEARETLEGKVFKFIMRDISFGRKFHIDTSTKLEGFDFAG